MDKKQNTIKKMGDYTVRINNYESSERWLSVNFIISSLNHEEYENRHQDFDLR